MVDEVKLAEGYQKTDIGLIPADWDLDEIQNLCKVTTGSKNTQDKIENGLYPFFVRSQTVERINCFSYNGEAVLTAGDGVGTGKVFHYINGKFDFHQRVYKMSDFTDRLDGYYFFQYFKKNFYNRIIQMTAKSSVDSVRRDMIVKMTIPLPSKPEQTAIATALSDMDALIEGLEKLIDKKRNIKQGAMQDLLKPKEGWEEKRIGEVIKSTQLGGNYPNNQVDNIIPLIKMGNLGRGNIVLNKIEYIERGTKPSEKDRLKYGDVLFNTRNTMELVGKVAIWKDELSMAYFNSNLMRLIFDPSFIESNFYMNYVLNSYILIRQLKDIATGTTSVAAIYSRDLFKIIIPLPPTKEEQTTIATALHSFECEIANLEDHLKKYKNIKTGMMQELLTGKKRLL